MNEVWGILLAFGQLVGQDVQQDELIRCYYLPYQVNTAAPGFYQVTTPIDTFWKVYRGEPVTLTEAPEPSTVCASIIQP